MYTATITRNFRDINTTTPKVLFLNIKDEKGNLFRDHCWVNINNLLEKYIPKHNKTKVKVKFFAKVKQYKTIGPIKVSFHAIRRIEKFNNKS